MKQVMLATMVLAMGISYFQPVSAPFSGIKVKAIIAPRQDSTSVSGEWYLQPVLASDTATGKLPKLRFDVGSRRFTGFTGCNQMSGSFKVQSDALQFDQNITLTKIECEGFNEKEFVMNLLRVDHYKIKDGVLWLMIGQTPVSKWMRKPGSKGTV